MRGSGGAGMVTSWNCGLRCGERSERGWWRDWSEVVGESGKEQVRQTNAQRRRPGPSEGGIYLQSGVGNCWPFWRNRILGSVMISPLLQTAAE